MLKLQGVNWGILCTDKVYDMSYPSKPKSAVTSEHETQREAVKFAGLRTGQVCYETRLLSYDGAYKDFTTLAGFPCLAVEGV